MLCSITMRQCSRQFHFSLSSARLLHLLLRFQFSFWIVYTIFITASIHTRTQTQMKSRKMFNLLDT